MELLQRYPPPRVDPLYSDSEAPMPQSNNHSRSTAPPSKLRCLQSVVLLFGVLLIKILGLFLRVWPCMRTTDNFNPLPRWKRFEEASKRQLRSSVCCVTAVVVAATLAFGFLLLLIKLQPPLEETNRLALNRHTALAPACKSHVDQIAVLKPPAATVTQAAIETRLLPCGANLDDMLVNLTRLHARHPDDGHRCLTAKHLNHSYAVISKQMVRDGPITIMMNLEEFQPLGNRTVDRWLTSDFFPLHPPVKVSMPESGRFTYKTEWGERPRVQFHTDELWCILDAYMVISGEHYLMFGDK